MIRAYLRDLINDPKPTKELNNEEDNNNEDNSEDIRDSDRGE